MSSLFYLALVGLVAAQRIAELRRSQRNCRLAVAAGAVERGGEHYPWMVALHSTFLLACCLEVWLLDRPLIVPLAAVAMAILVAATVLRYAAVRALGERWTTRVFRWPDRRLVKSGPYRLMRHPNYVAVVLEILALPLVHTAWITAVVFSILNGFLLRARIGVEDLVIAEAAEHGRDGNAETARGGL